MTVSTRQHIFTVTATKLICATQTSHHHHYHRRRLTLPFPSPRHTKPSIAAFKRFSLPTPPWSDKAAPNTTKPPYLTSSRPTPPLLLLLPPALPSPFALDEAPKHALSHVCFDYAVAYTLKARCVRPALKKGVGGKKSFLDAAALNLLSHGLRIRQH